MEILSGKTSKIDFFVHLNKYLNLNNPPTDTYPRNIK